MGLFNRGSIYIRANTSPNLAPIPPTIYNSFHIFKDRPYLRYGSLGISYLDTFSITIPAPSEFRMSTPLNEALVGVVQTAFPRNMKASRTVRRNNELFDVVVHVPLSLWDSSSCEHIPQTQLP